MTPYGWTNQSHHPLPHLSSLQQTGYRSWLGRTDGLRTPKLSGTATFGRIWRRTCDYLVHACV
jgi:hypothetical protein